MRKRLVLVDERGGPSPLNRLIYGRIVGKEGHPPGAQAETTLEFSCQWLDFVHLIKVRVFRRCSSVANVLFHVL
jgi:hypothetical protein